MSAAATPNRTTLSLPRLQGAASLELHFLGAVGAAPASLYVALWPAPPADAPMICAWAGTQVSLYHAGGERGGCLMYVGEVAVWISSAELPKVRAALIATGIKHVEKLGGGAP